MFSEADDPSKRFKIDADILGVKAQFMKANSIYDATLFDEKIFGIKLDATVDLKVVEAPPGVKGDTARGGNKLVKVDTGAMVTNPPLRERRRHHQDQYLRPANTRSE